MYVLDPLYYNSTGIVYIIKNKNVKDRTNQKLQLQIGDTAILMDIKEMEIFLDVIRSARKKCQCNNKNCSRTIKCNTPHAEINFKLTPSILDGLEELVLGVLFHEEYNNILQNNKINKSIY
ncbi:hypothetical protein ATE84_5173 [Aquimarina sp. MAR_2010_214]|uniref:hypothetical protein n=1 Tax=Aquimarina sp. MAR_2010_214 TaxID=1250026 RepID=UPI000C700CED|nr:hypothetical protein [Aquimarina sp. MAR_2010_214]PKV53039.1 hypothetical protein ATE84_5173 [Aquimarina sp. MAR_2010_214]